MKSSKMTLVMIGIIFLLMACSGNDETNELDSESTTGGEDTMDTFNGYWEGEIQTPGQPLPIIVEFEQESGMISIPVQGVNEYPLSNIKLNPPDLFFEMDLQGQQITFDGELAQEKIAGTFTQQGQSFPFELTKGTKEEAGEVDAEDGEIHEVEVKGGMMQGKMERPEGEGPFPVTIIIAGSGPTDKDGNSVAIPGKNNSLKMLAEDLAAEGIASIRYDKRGVGKNMSLGGREEDLRFDDYIGDAAAWINYAKNDDLFSSVSVTGHSEGSLIGMVASYQENADAFISVAGAGRPVDEVLIEQFKTQLPSNLMQESEDILDQLKQGEQVQDVSPELESIFRASVQPYMMSWLEYDPQEELANIDAPILIINGTRDLQVPVYDAEVLHGVTDNSDLFIVEKMNHVLKEAPEDEGGNLATYSDPNLPLAEGLMERIIEFLKK